MERASYTCEMPQCNNWGSDCHHYIPRSQGGNDTEKNLISLCRQHHQDLHFGSLEQQEWIEDNMVEVLSDYYEDWNPSKDCMRDGYILVE
jgi:predicted restriction endonuclease